MAAGGLREADVTEGPFWNELARRQNHGVRGLEVLDGNVRVLRYDGFFWNGEASRAAIDAAVALLRGGDAIVIDLRDNGGGSPDAVRHLVSYFVPANAKLITFHMRDDPPTVTHAEAEVPGGRIAGVPIYVLTSDRTASAAEEFAAHVTDFGFASLVGQTTAGAAYRNDFFPVPGGLVLSVSVGRPELPKGGDWEGKGVAPRYKVPHELALDRALQEALARLAAKAQGPLRTELEWAAAAKGARVAPATPPLALAAYAGRYGERTIALEGQGLIFQRDGGLRSPLLPLGGDLFAIERDRRSRLRFVSAKGVVTGFVLERVDGSAVAATRG